MAFEHWLDAEGVAEAELSNMRVTSPTTMDEIAIAISRMRHDRNFRERPVCVPTAIGPADYRPEVCREC